MVHDLNCSKEQLIHLQKVVVHDLHRFFPFLNTKEYLVCRRMKFRIWYLLVVFVIVLHYAEAKPHKFNFNQLDYAVLSNPEVSAIEDKDRVGILRQINTSYTEASKVLTHTWYTVFDEVWKLEDLDVASDSLFDTYYSQAEKLSCVLIEWRNGKLNDLDVAEIAKKVDEMIPKLLQILADGNNEAAKIIESELPARLNYVRNLNFECVLSICNSLRPLVQLIQPFLNHS